jgi:predicted ferric reductase
MSAVVQLTSSRCKIGIGFPSLVWIILAIQTGIAQGVNLTRIQIAFVAIVLFIIGVWWTSDTLLPSAANSRAQAVAFTQISGILAIGLMAASGILSARPVWLEPYLDGLDKMYRLHKWLGISGLALGVLHWLTAAGSGRRPGPPTGGAAPEAPDGAMEAANGSAQAMQGPLQALHGPAHGIAEPALFILIALVAIALIPRVPYRLFAKTHLITVPVFLALAFHSVVLMKSEYWFQPAGWMVIGLCAIGAMGSLIGLANFLGWRRVSHGAVDDCQYYPELRVLEIDMTVDDRWPGHRAGQFAFVTTDALEGAHPFTIANNWEPATHKISFIAKELGDNTAALRKNFAPGRSVKVQGPYGQFDFDDNKKRQIWVGGGIGITPFVAKMRELSHHKTDKKIDLFHSTTQVSEIALQEMRDDAKAAGVRLHLTITPRDSKLDFQAIAAAVPDWREASVWFCGPTAFGETLRKGFVENGLDRDDFHQELFQMR